MKAIYTLTIILLISIGCNNSQMPKAEELPISEIQEDTFTFRQVFNFPIIKDSSQFIADLKRVFELEVDESANTKERITAYKKVELYGADKEYFLIEYDYGYGSMAAYPWKFQLLLTTEGVLVKKLAGKRFELITIFQDRHPFLLILDATAKGNGGHYIYRITADTLENIYEGYYNYDLRTYDAHEDDAVYEPNELDIQFKDDDGDGFNDIVFSGYQLMLVVYAEDGGYYDTKIVNGKASSFTVQNPAKKIPVEFVFLYDEESGHFIEK